jgi:hypothetical protein
VGVLLLLYFAYIGISLYMNFLALLPATLRMAHKNHLRDPGLSPVEPLRGGSTEGKVKSFPEYTGFSLFAARYS